MEVELAGHLRDFSQSLAKARVSTSPNKFRFSRWGIESKNFYYQILYYQILEGLNPKTFITKFPNSCTKLLLPKSKIKFRFSRWGIESKNFYYQFFYNQILYYQILYQKLLLPNFITKTFITKFLSYQIYYQTHKNVCTYWDTKLPEW